MQYKYTKKLHIKYHIPSLIDQARAITMPVVGISGLTS